MAGLDELSARSALATMQDRLERDPASALGINARATPAEVRAAFLALTKLFHPVRFGRMATDIQKLSNEVFLALRAAHDSLAKAARNATGPIPVAIDRAGSAPTGSAPVVVPGSPAASPTSPNGARLAPRPMISQPGNGATARPAPPGPAGPATRPLAAPANTPAARLPAKPVRQSGPVPVVAPPATEAAAIDLLQRQQWEAARTMLHQLRARDPAGKRIPALMAYARGREAQLDGRVDDARVELQEALELDPNLQLAKDAHAELFRRRK